MQELTLMATLENVQTAVSFAEELLEEMDCPLKAQMQVAVAVDEVFSNIVHYAYGAQTGEATIRLERLDDPACVEVTFLDRGKPYDPLTQEDPDVTLSAEERAIGGLGIFIVKKTMDQVRYEYRDGQNILTIRKSL